MDVASQLPNPKVAPGLSARPYSLLNNGGRARAGAEAMVQQASKVQKKTLSNSAEKPTSKRHKPSTLNSFSVLDTVKQKAPLSDSVSKIIYF